MEEFLGNYKRSKLCGNFSLKDLGKKVTAMGFVAKYRNLGSIMFIDLRDRSGIVQLSFLESIDSLLFEKASHIRNEFVIAVKGIIQVRGKENINPNLATGEIEIIVNELKILSKADTTPFNIGDSNVNENLRLKYRYLDLRRADLQKQLLLRNKITNIVHNYMSKNHFLHIETPFLGKSTPEGARDYLVPSRVNQGSFYALPQSPQIYKQLLMIAGYDRYYQIAKCFRDEDLRANRQPEFTQIDIEMSYVSDVRDVIKITEGLIKEIFNKTLNLNLKSKFKQITYKDAMNIYGSDKPDTRFEMFITDITGLAKKSEFVLFKNSAKKGYSVRGICVKGAANFTRKEIEQLQRIAQEYKAKGLISIALKEDGIYSSISKFFTSEQLKEIINKFEAKQGDLILIVADKNQIVCNALGAVRLAAASKLNLIDKNQYSFLWVVDFPLFEFDEEENRLVAMHHPFTSPLEKDLKYLDKNPLKVRSKAYDLVINGQEAGGGSIRIHSRELQKKMFERIGLSDDQINSRFGFFVNAFNYGVPPHGGLAFGLDRLVMLIGKTDNIKDVIAFPKNQNAQCLMSEAPSEVDIKQMEELSLAITGEKGSGV